ncbi:MAG TPA: HAMP domain-containing sensor histidine kinase [Jatrophihabitans sp.]|nr:HAMP domain-containing sensor histidine kinase [Jatrophihabitans sp.]
MATGWLVFAIVNTALMYLLPGEETIPYHLIWASFALLYGLYRWSMTLTWIVFASITVVTGIALIEHARAAIIGWEECSEIVLMGVLVALLIWHVRRHQDAQQRLDALRLAERSHAEQREIAARFGSHEVRTRLTIARGFADLIRERAQDELTRSDATVVTAELDKAAALTTMLLALVRVEAPVVWEPVDLVELVSGVLARWRRTAERRWHADIRVSTMLANPERLESALDCLIENAVKFTGPDDLIAIRATAVGDQVWLSVLDSGPGIPADDLPRVAEIFRTGSGAGDRAGSGLGLAIVRAIVESRGGTMLIESEPGRGTAITLCIPASCPEEWPLARTGAPAQTESVRERPVSPEVLL